MKYLFILITVILLGYMISDYVSTTTEQTEDLVEVMQCVEEEFEARQGAGMEEEEFFLDPDPQTPDELAEEITAYCMWKLGYEPE